jgi:mono/diheme cytochrome c family protein
MWGRIMEEQKNNSVRPPSVGRRVFGWLIFIGAVIVIGGVIVLYSGIYNVAASKGHSAAVEWILGTASDRSVSYHSRNIQPPELTHDMSVVGAEHYGQMCVGCHGGPGQTESDIAQGLYPPPPDLAGAATEMTPAEIFWIVKNGVVDTGMPAFGVTHDDQKIWDITAFVMDLPKLSQAQFEEMIGKKHSGVD